MKRRDFVLKSLITLCGINVAFKAIAAIVWAAPGKLQYKEVAPPNMQKMNRTCATCGYYRPDKRSPGGGLCTFSGIMNLNKSKEVFVKDTGHCSMWKKA